MITLPKKIGKKLREQAIMIAAAEASNPDCTENTYKTAELLGLPDYAAELALQAWRAVAFSSANYDGEPFTESGGRQAVSAEAEALLRSGWSPGEPVRLLTAG